MAELIRLTNTTQRTTLDPMRSQHQRRRLAKDDIYLVFDELARESMENVTHTYPNSIEVPESLHILQWFRRLRLVSREFNKMLTPLCYQFIDFSSRDPENIPDDIKAKIIANAKVVWVDFGLSSWQQTLNIVKLCNRVEDLRWAFEEEDEEFLEEEGNTRGIQYQLAVMHGLMAISTSNPNVKHVIVEYYIPHGGIASIHPCHGYGFLPDLAVKDAISIPESPDTLASLHWEFGFPADGGEMLPQLETIHIPKARVLKLDNYHWKLSRDQFSSVWDLSELRHLTLNDSDVVGFSHGASQLYNLRSLEILGYYRCNTDELEHSQLSNAIKSMFSSFMRLERFHLCWKDGWQQIISIPTLSIVLPTLKQLILEHENTGPQQVSPVDELAKICQQSWVLEELKLNIGTPSKEYIKEIISVLPRFRKLKILTLTVWKELESYAEIENSTDPVYDAAHDTMRRLASRKLSLGSSFTEIVMIVEYCKLQPGLESYPDSHTGHVGRFFVYRLDDSGEMKPYGAKRWMGVEAHGEPSQANSDHAILEDVENDGE